MERGVSSFRHPERSRGIFFVSRFRFLSQCCLHETPSFRFAGSTVFPARRYPHILCLTANEKDFSLSLEMTIWGKRHSRIVSLPHWGRGTAQRWIGCSRISPARDDLPALFHTASTLSGSLRSPPSPRGEGFVSGIPLSPSNLRPFGAPPSIGRS